MDTEWAEMDRLIAQIEPLELAKPRAPKPVGVRIALASIDDDVTQILERYDDGRWRVIASGHGSPWGLALEWEAGELVTAWTDRQADELRELREVQEPIDRGSIAPPVGTTARDVVDANRFSLRGWARAGESEGYDR